MSRFVTTQWLADHLDDPDIQVIDASWHMPNSGRNAHAEYVAGHVPGAIFFDLDKNADIASGLPHMLPDAETFSAMAGALGIASDKTLVVYDEAGPFSAPAGRDGEPKIIRSTLAIRSPRRQHLTQNAMTTPSRASKRFSPPANRASRYSTPVALPALPATRPSRVPGSNRAIFHTAATSPSIPSLPMAPSSPATNWKRPFGPPVSIRKSRSSPPADQVSPRLSWRWRSTPSAPKRWRSMTGPGPNGVDATMRRCKPARRDEVFRPLTRWSGIPDCVPTAWRDRAHCPPCGSTYPDSAPAFRRRQRRH